MRSSELKLIVLIGMVVVMAGFGAYMFMTQSSQDADDFTVPARRDAAPVATPAPDVDFATSPRSDAPATAPSGEPVVTQAEPVVEATSAGALTGEFQYEISGRVLDADDRQPITGAVIAVQGGERRTDAADIRDARLKKLQAISGADGSYRIAFDYSHDMATLRLQAVHGLNTEKTVTVSVSSGVAAQQDILIASGGSIRGRVMAYGKPVAGADVKLRRDIDVADMLHGVSRAITTMEDDELSGLDRTLPSVNTDANGEFLFDGVAAAKYRILAEHDNYAPGKTAEPVEVRKREETAGVIVELTDGAAIEGRVLTLDGRPIAGAEVRLNDTRVAGGGGGMIMMNFNDDRGYQATTREDGGFAISPIMPGTYQVSVQAKGYAVFSDSQMLTLQDRAERKDLEYRLDQGVVIAGHVMDTYGQPVAGARVSMMGRDEGMGFSFRNESASTDKDGRFEFTGVTAKDKSELTAAAQGYFKNKAAAMPGDTNVLITLEKSPEIRGRVIGPNGQAMTRFRVQARDKARGDGLLGGLVMIEDMMGGAGVSFEDPNGEFVLKGAPSKQFDLVASADGFTDSAAFSVNLNNGVPASIVLQVQQAASITGRVVDASGSPVAKASVTLLQAGNGGIMAMIGGGAAVMTDAKGEFTLTEVEPNSEVTLQVSANGWATQKLSDIHAYAGQTIDVGDIRLSAGATLRGHVYDEKDKPVKGMMIMVNGSGFDFKQAVSDAGGYYEIAGLPSGRVQVNAGSLRMGRDSGGMGWQSVTLELVDGRVTEHDFRPPKDLGDLTGTIFVNRQPSKGMTVTLFPKAQGGMMDMKNAITNAEGVYRLEKIPAGAYTMSVSFSMFSADYSQDVVISANQKLIVDVHLDTGAVEAKIVDQTGTPVSGAKLDLQRLDAPAAGGMIAVAGIGDLMGGGGSDADGKLLKKNVVTGRYKATVSKSGYLKAVIGEVQVGPGQTAALGTVTLRLIEHPGSVTGVVTDATGAPVAMAMVQLLDTDGEPLQGGGLFNMMSGPTGKYSIKQVPPGMYTLRAQAQGQAMLQTGTFEVGPDAVVTRDLQLAAAGIVQITATVGGAPAALAAVTIRDGGGNVVMPPMFSAGLTTDAQGIFDADWLAVGAYTLEIVHPGTGKRATVPVQVNASTPFQATVVLQ